MLLKLGNVSAKVVTKGSQTLVVELTALNKLCRESHRAVDTPPSVRRESGEKKTQAPNSKTPVVVLKRKVGQYQGSSSESDSDGESSDCETATDKLRRITKQIKRIESPLMSIYDVSQQDNTTIASSSDAPPTKITYNMMSKRHPYPKFAKCSVGEQVVLRLAGLYTNTAVSQMELSEQEILRFTTVDATVIAKKNNTECVLRIEGLSNVCVQLTPLRYEQNVNLPSSSDGEEEKVHHSAVDLSNLIHIDREEYKLITCLIEQSEAFVRGEM
eukprot:gene28382-35227_t